MKNFISVWVVALLEIKLLFISLPFYLLYKPEKIHLFTKNIGVGRYHKVRALKEHYHIRRKVGLHGAGLAIIILLIVGLISAIPFFFSNAAAEQFNWDFNTPAEYTYDSGKAHFVSGKIQLRSTNNDIIDDSQAEFDLGNYDDIIFNTDHLELISNEIVATTDTLALYHLNEASGNAIDDSGNGYDGDVYGADQTVTGKFNNGIKFDGTDDYIEITDDLGDPSEMTLEFWFNKSNMNGGAEYLMDGRSGGNWWFLQDYTSGANCPDTNGNICFNSLVEIPSSLLSNDTWYHVALTASAAETKIYLNGTLIDTGAGINPDLGTNIRVGSRYTGVTFLDAYMDEIAIWDTVLDQSTINSHAQGGYKSSGEYSSDIFDAGQIVPWNEISWTEDLLATNWFSYSWGKRKPIIIDNTLNSNSLSDHQVRMEIMHEADMNSDFSDLRFTDSDGITELDYWIHEYTASTNAMVWVEVPSITASSLHTIYVYYGNNSAITSSNGLNTFLLFDDFNDGIVDIAKWTETDIPENEIIESGGVLNFIRTTNGAWNKSIISNTTFSRSDLSFEYDYEWTVNNASYDAIMVGWHDSGTVPSYPNQVYAFYNPGSGAADTVNATVYEDGSSRSGVTGSWIVNTDYDVRVRMRASGGAYYEQSTDNGDSWTTSYTSTYSTESDLKPSWSFFSGTHEFDNARVRKWANPEPSVSFGSEQTPTIGAAQFQARSCDDASCDSELFIGPDGSSSTYYTTASGEAINASSDQYFQYKLYLSSADPEYSSPQVDSVSIASNIYNDESPTVVPTDSFTAPEVTAWDTFVETSIKTGNAEIYYQLSQDDGATWQYYNGSSWIDIVASTDYNIATETNNNFSSYTTDNNQLVFKAFLVSDGSGQAKLDNVKITYSSELNTQVDVKDWHFLTPAEYTYDTNLIEVTVSNARLLQSGGSFSDSDQSDFAGTFLQTTFNTDHIELSMGDELSINANTEALYHFNEATGDAISEETTFYDGTATDTTWTTGQFGTAALEFNGSDSMVLPTAGVGDGMLDAHTAHTIEAWVKRNSNSNRQAVFIEGGTTYGYGLYLNDDSGDITHIVRSAAGTFDEITYPVSNLNLDEWYHLAGVWDGGTGELSLYVNGTQVATKVTAIASIPNPGNGWRIGGTGTEVDVIDGSTSITIDGIIEELKIYDVALASPDVQNDYSSISSGNYTSEIKDAGSQVAWNSISWDQVLTGQILNDALQTAGGVATATTSNPGNPATTINDGLYDDTQNGWGNNDVVDSRLMVDLASAEDVGEIKIYFGGDETQGGWGAQYLPKSYRIQVATDDSAVVTNSVNDSKWITLTSADSLTTDQGTVSGDSIITGFTLSDYDTLVTHTFDAQSNIVSARLHFNGTNVGEGNRIGQVGEFIVNVEDTSIIQAQVRSCNDASCDTEIFAGPDGTGATYYNELAIGSSSPSLNLTNVSNNQYLQYKIYLDENNLSASPQFSDLSVSAYGAYTETKPFIYPSNSLQVPGVIEWQTFEETATKPTGSELYYQLSYDDGASWLWYSGSSWTDIADGLPSSADTVLLYHFSENSGDVTDSSSYANNATNYGASQDVTGMFGHALYFDGVDDYLEAPYLAELNLESTDFSIEFWLKTTDSDGFILKKYSGELGGDAWAVDVASDDLRFYDGTSWINSGIDVTDDQWKYVGIVADDSADSISFYIDSALIITDSFDDILGNLYPLYIGKEVDDGFFEGTIDELRISHSMRTADDMILAMNLYNTADEVNDNILSFPITNGQLLFRSFLESDGVVTPSLDNIRVTYKYANNNPPATTVPASIAQSTDGDGLVSFETEVSDADNEQSRLMVEYSDDGGLNWYDAELLSVSVDSGTVDLNNGNTYQIGTGDPIDTDSGTITVSVVWDTKSASNENGSLDGVDSSDIQIRVRAYDGVSPGSLSVSASFDLDNLAPGGLGSFFANSSTSNAISYSWDAVATEDSFSHYEIWYDLTQSDVENRSGASEWDDNDDSTLSTMTTNLTTVSGLASSKQYYARIWAVDDSGNEQESATVSYTTAAAAGGGGGGGGGFIPPATTTSSELNSSIGNGTETFSLKDSPGLDIGEINISGYNILANNGSTALFSVFTNEKLNIKAVYDDYVTITLPDGRDYNLYTKKRIQVDLDDNICNDFEVYLNRIGGGIADMTIRKVVGYKLDEVDPNSLVKSPDNTAVYYYGKDCKRHVFPNALAYETWYLNFDDIYTITSNNLASIPISDNVTYRPGVRLIKIISIPKVYAVSANGSLRWISTEEIAVVLYGENWASYVDDVPDSFFMNYTIGDDILSVSDYNINEETSTAETIDVDKGLAFVGTETGAEISSFVVLPDSSSFIPGDIPDENSTDLITENSDCVSNIEFTSFLSVGMNSSEIKEMQILLQCLGFFPQDQVANGNFGAITEQAVKNFQAAYGIDQVGYVGPGTREALNKY